MIYLPYLKLVKDKRSIDFHHLHEGVFGNRELDLSGKGHVQDGTSHKVQFIGEDLKQVVNSFLQV